MGAAAAPLSIEDAFQPRTFYQPVLSPDGRHVVAIGQMRATGPFKQATTVMLIDAATLDAKPIYGPAVGWDAPTMVSWAGNGRLVVDAGARAFVMNLDGEVTHRLRGRYLRSVRPGVNGHERVLVVRTDGISYAERVDVVTGKGDVVDFDVPGKVISWVFDADGVPRVVTTRSTAFWSDDTQVTHWWRASIHDKWQALASFPLLRIEWTPVHLTNDGKAMVVRSGAGRDNLAFFRFDLEQRRITDLMVGHPTEDVAWIQYDMGGDELMRVQTLGMKRVVHWFDARWAALQRAVDAALPNRDNWLTGDSEGRVLIDSSSDVDPGQWHLLDTDTMTMRKLASAMPHIDPRNMFPKRIVEYRSTDGITIPAYLTLPHEVNGPLPAVVLVHGGPVARDSWDWDPSVQLLASRGYAVLQPQFRGSAGFGLRFEQAGYGQWGLAMQDDVTAGAQWLVAQKIADPKRMCIYGGSYGGYAAMWALVKTPELFRCGISFAGVSDLNDMFRSDSDINDSATARLSMRLIIGDPVARRQQFDDVSPLKHAASIKAPVLISHGSRDVRVPVEQSEKLVAALKSHGKQVRWMPLRGEGHGIGKEENLKRHYEAVFEFLATHIGPTPSAVAASAPAH